MKKFDWAILWETVKFPLRILVLAVIPFLITYLTELPTSWAVAATTILTLVDKFLHELWKEEKIDRNGLVPF